MSDKKVAGKNGNVWQKLDWAGKVALCEQGRASENSLLQSYRFIFIALETILFAGIFSAGWHWWGVFFAILGLGLAALWMRVCELRGNAVDRWEEILASLWQEADKSETEVSEFAGHYKGAVERRERRRKSGRLAVFRGWGGVKRFLSARWVLNSLMPCIVVGLWIFVIVRCFCC